jgi:hypothetical protein
MRWRIFNYVLLLSHYHLLDGNFYFLRHMQICTHVHGHTYMGMNIDLDMKTEVHAETY